MGSTVYLAPRRQASARARRDLHLYLTVSQKQLGLLAERGNQSWAALHRAQAAAREEFELTKILGTDVGELAVLEVSGA